MPTLRPHRPTVPCSMVPRPAAFRPSPRALVAALLLAVLLLGGCSIVHELPMPAIPAPAAPLTIAPDKKPALIGLEGVVLNVKRGQVVGALYTGMAPNSVDLCNYKGAGTFSLSDSRRLISGRDDDLNGYFYDALTARGYAVTGNPAVVFKRTEELSKAKYLLGARITDLKMNICRVYGSWTGQALGTSAAEVYMEVEWSVYSGRKRDTVLTVPTVGYARLDEAALDGEFLSFAEAFTMNAEELAANKDFYDLVSNKEELTEKLPPAPAETLHVQGVRLRTTPFTADPDPVVNAVATVIIDTGGIGSAFLISRDGYMLTNHHVAGDPGNQVHVRFKSGIELPAKVVRSDKYRDVALLKVGLDNAPALAIRTRPVTVAERVYAIGTPKAEKLHHTVSNGVVSALRVFRDEGVNLSYIQSDVPIHGGNSGGSLVDAEGNVVGITVAGMGMKEDKTNASLNLFIPIADALERLNVNVFLGKEP